MGRDWEQNTAGLGLFEMVVISRAGSGRSVWRFRELARQWRIEQNRSGKVIGTTIGNYQIKHLIGEGNNGRVFLAFHPGLGRRAAVKVLATFGTSDPDMVSRFATEARAVGGIDHENIVKVYDSGSLDGGTPYIVMEYLDGEPLTRALSRGPASLKDAVDWAWQRKGRASQRTFEMDRLKPAGAQLCTSRSRLQ